MALRDVRDLPITAFMLLLEAWREEDEHQRDATMQAQFVANRVEDNDALETYINKKNKHG